MAERCHVAKRGTAPALRLPEVTGTPWTVPAHPWPQAARAALTCHSSFPSAPSPRDRVVRSAAKMHRRAAARLLQVASRPLQAASLAGSAPRTAVAAARLAGLHSSTSAPFAWGRSSGLDSTPDISLGRTGTTPHVGIVVCPQQTALVVERFGKFSRVLEPGLHLLVPLVDRIGYSWSLKEEAVPVKAQTAITRDNVAIMIDGVLYVKVRQLCLMAAQP